MGDMELVFDKLFDFMNRHNICCAEDVYQCDSVNEACVDFVAELVSIVLEGGMSSDRALGTVEELKVASDKQVATTAHIFGDGYADGHLVYDTYEARLERYT